MLATNVSTETEVVTKEEPILRFGFCRVGGSMYNLNGLFVGRTACLRRQQTKRDPSVTLIFPDPSYARGCVDEYNYGHIPRSGQATLISYSHHTPYTEVVTTVLWAAKLPALVLKTGETVGHSAPGVQAILHCMGWRPNAPECKKTATKSCSFLHELYLFNCILLSFWVLAAPENSVKEAPLLGRGEVYLFTSYA